ncbi:hypothetical protein NQ318_011457 [Aromia moschata]|uniref:HTH CENPB-type domain-containing protein n=1 Tax=Aromia moschata TaxID=1265417 RepID=A0AAV8X9F9_9CUCU|nr:hypothetical protein NQ318_011457 [Aromia moschata]
MLPGAKKRVMQRKEPAKRLTLEQKLELIKHAKNGVKNFELCKMYNICKSSVTEILRKKEIYLSQFEKRRKLSGRIDTKKCTGTYDTPFEISVFYWFLQRRTLGEPVSSMLLKENFYKETDFQASDGWLRGFKDRHGIKTLNTKGEKLSADTEEPQAYYLGLNERVMQRKEPAKRLTLEQKLELINHAKNGVKNVELCKMYNICKSSVTEILGKKKFTCRNLKKDDNLVDGLTQKSAPVLMIRHLKEVFLTGFYKEELLENLSQVCC